jgi:PAS domain S-box-containing protein
MEPLAEIAEHSDDAIIGKTLDGVITSWSPAALRMFGYSSDEVIGQSVDLLSPEDRKDEMIAILARIRTGRHLEHFETICVRKDGTVFPVSISVSPIRDADGVIVGASTITHDATKQRRAFEAARSMIEASLDSLVAISPEGKITDANQATVKLTGVPRDDLIGTAFSDYFTEPEKANEIYQKVFAVGMAVDYPLTIRSRDGTLTEVLYNASVYRTATGEVLGVFAAARDVTKQVLAQRELAERQAGELDRLAELERFQRLTVGRELKMIELKKEIEHLTRLLKGHGDEVGNAG